MSRGDSGTRSRVGGLGPRPAAEVQRPMATRPRLSGIGLAPNPAVHIGTICTVIDICQARVAIGVLSSGRPDRTGLQVMNRRCPCERGKLRDEGKGDDTLQLDAVGFQMKLHIVIDPGEAKDRNRQHCFSGHTSVIEEAAA